MRISDWSSDVCSSDLSLGNAIADAQLFATRDAGARIAFMNNSGIRAALIPRTDGPVSFGDIFAVQPFGNQLVTKSFTGAQLLALLEQQFDDEGFVQTFSARSEEHTSELQSLMRISYAVFCLKKKT